MTLDQHIRIWDLLQIGVYYCRADTVSEAYLVRIIQRIRLVPNNFWTFVFVGLAADWVVACDRCDILLFIILLFIMMLDAFDTATTSPTFFFSITLILWHARAVSRHDTIHQLVISRTTIYPGSRFREMPTVRLIGFPYFYSYVKNIVECGILFWGETAGPSRPRRTDVACFAGF